MTVGECSDYVDPVFRQSPVQCCFIKEIIYGMPSMAILPAYPSELYAFHAVTQYVYRNNLRIFYPNGTNRRFNVVNGLSLNSLHHHKWLFS